MNGFKLNDLRKDCRPFPSQSPDKPSASKWFDPAEQGKVFAHLLYSDASGPFLELGSWTGAGSSRFVVQHFKSMDLICVDTWEGSPEHHRIKEYNKVRVNLWDHFCSNLWEYRDRVYPLQMKTVRGMNAVFKSGIKPEIIYIDAAHDEDSVYADISGALTLFPDSKICGDDYTPNKHPGVSNAINKCIKDGLFSKQEFKHHGRCWYLTRNT
mgnify:CR=1 FL=1